MDCPNCGSPMKKGVIKLEHKMEAFLEQWPTLIFRDYVEEGVPIVSAFERRSAHHCGSCGGMYVSPQGADLLPEPGYLSYPARDGECSQCGVSLKPGRTDCHWCGGCAEA